MLKGKRDAIRKRRVSTKHIKQKKKQKRKLREKNPNTRERKTEKLSLRCAYTGSDETEKKVIIGRKISY